MSDVDRRADLGAVSAPGVATVRGSAKGRADGLSGARIRDDLPGCKQLPLVGVFSISGQKSWSGRRSETPDSQGAPVLKERSRILHVDRRRSKMAETPSPERPFRLRKHPLSPFSRGMHFSGESGRPLQTIRKWESSGLLLAAS